MNVFHPSGLGLSNNTGNPGQAKRQVKSLPPLPSDPPISTTLGQWDLGRSLTPKQPSDEPQLQPPKPTLAGDWHLEFKRSTVKGSHGFVTCVGQVERVKNAKEMQWVDRSGQHPNVCVGLSAGLFEASPGIFWDTKILYDAKHYVTSFGGVSISLVYQHLLTGYYAQKVHKTNPSAGHDKPIGSTTAVEDLDCPSLGQFTDAYQTFIHAQVPYLYGVPLSTWRHAPM